LGRDWSFTVGYHGIHAIHLLSSASMNGVPNRYLPDGRLKSTPADTGLDFAVDAARSGRSTNNTATVSLRREFKSHGSLLANYNCGESVDIATADELQDEP